MFEVLALVLIAVGLAAACVRLYLRMDRTRDQLDKLEREHAAVLRHQFELMAVLSPEGRVLSVSDSLYLVQQGKLDAASSAQSMVGKMVWEARWLSRPGGGQAEWERHLRDAALSSSDEPIFFRLVSRSQRGHSRTAHTSLQAIKSPLGELEGYVLHAKDVTEQEQQRHHLRTTSEALDQQSHILMTTLNSTAQGIMMVDPTDRVITYNQRLCELLELSPEVLQGHPLNADLLRMQMQRGDFGEDASLVGPEVRAFAQSFGKVPAPPAYSRTTPKGRVLEVKTQMLPGGGFVRTFTDNTEAAARDAELRRALKLLQGMQTMSGVGGWEIDLITRSVHWTDEVYRIIGSAPGDFEPTMAQTLALFAPPRCLAPALDPRPDGDGSDGETLLLTQPYDEELQITTSDGRLVWLHTKSEVQQHGGQPVRYTAVLQDVTARKAADEALRQSQDLIREVTSRLPGMVYRQVIRRNGDRQYLYVSSGVRELIGVSPEDVMADGLLLRSMTHPDDRARVSDNPATYSMKPSTGDVEFRMFDKGGQLKWVQLRFSSYGMNDGESVMRHGVLMDITKRKLAEQELREQDALWRVALESTGDGMWEYNLETHQSILSERFLERFGYTRTDLMEDSNAEWNRLIHPDDVEQYRKDLEAYLQGEASVYINERRILAKDGSYRWILSRGTAIKRDAGGKPLRMIGTHTDITDRKRNETLIWQHANFDALTGLLNRRMLRDRLEQDMKKCLRNHSKLAVLFIDLDHFKEINDTMGHVEGDALLVEAANRLKNCVRDTDTVARMGGDEFTIIVPGLNDATSIERIVQSILVALEQPFTLGGEKSFISASVGITMFPDDADSIDDLFKQADQALYLAKDNGRNGFSFFTHSLQEAAQQRVRLSVDLRTALDLDQFFIEYQPIVDLATQSVQKAEALLRWVHPLRGRVSPADFVPLAESTGLIVPIGDWVFKRAVDQVKVWRQTHHPDFQISINKSPVQFHHKRDAAGYWTKHLQASGLPGNCISIEITEGLLLDKSSAVHAQLQTYRDAGISLALDDFGTGYSSLAYLQNYDIHIIKIDQSFVRRLKPNSKDLGICRAIITMAHELGLKVVAEGVETAEQRRLLLSAGCDYGQGYLFSRPLSADAFGEFLRLKRQQVPHDLDLIGTPRLPDAPRGG